MKVMETQITKTGKTCFTKMFGSDSHSINVEHLSYIILPKTGKICTKIASFDCCRKWSEISISATRKVILYCLPFSNSEPEVGEETESSETTGLSQSVRVRFQLEQECQFGDGFLIVGNDPILGSWNPSDAIPLNWSGGHIWSIVLELPVAKSIQYKFLLKKTTGGILWQPGTDRSFQTWETKNVITVTEEWDNAEAQKISEEEQIIDQNEKLMNKSLIEPSVLKSPKDSKERHVPAVSSTVRGLSPDKTAGDEHKDEAHQKQNSSSSVVKKGRNSDKHDKRRVTTSKNYEKQRAKADKSSSVEAEEGNLVIDDEGPVLVPGLTLPLSSSKEALAKDN